MVEACAECVVSVSFFTNGLQTVYVSGDLSFADIESSGDHVLSGVGDKGAIVCVPFASQAKAARCDVVTFR